MSHRSNDGSAGDADYAKLGQAYSSYRQPDPRIAEAILEVLGEANTILNVGAGAGSYEPVDRTVTAVEPSASMRAQRPLWLTPAIDATAEDLPFADDAFDAALATFTVHQWHDLQRGLSEMRRVTRGPVVILTADPNLLNRFWLLDYAREVIEVERRRYPTVDQLAASLGACIHVSPVPIPLQCVDGFNEAYYGRPEQLLDPLARLSNSAWSFVAGLVHERFENELAEELASGRWDERFGYLRTQPTFEGSLVLVVSDRR